MMFEIKRMRNELNELIEAVGPIALRRTESDDRHDDAGSNRKAYLNDRYEESGSNFDDEHQ